jgi:hypothetical protein
MLGALTNEYSPRRVDPTRHMPRPSLRRRRGLLVAARSHIAALRKGTAMLATTATSFVTVAGTVADSLVIRTYERIRLTCSL